MGDLSSYNKSRTYLLTVSFFVFLSEFFSIEILSLPSIPISTERWDSMRMVLLLLLIWKSYRLVYNWKLIQKKLKKEIIYLDFIVTWVIVCFSFMLLIVQSLTDIELREYFNLWNWNFMMISFSKVGAFTLFIFLYSNFSSVFEEAKFSKKGSYSILYYIVPIEFVISSISIIYMYNFEVVVSHFSGFVLGLFFWVSLLFWHTVVKIKKSISIF